LAIATKKSGNTPLGGPPVKPTELNVDVPPCPGLSADPTAGVLPSSIPPTLSEIQAEELHLTSRTPPTVPIPIRTLRRVSVGKLCSLRSASSHPIVPDHLLPKQLSVRSRAGYGDASTPMHFPRSVNRMRSPGDGLTPAESGLRIDLGIRSVLGRIDTGAFTDHDVDEVKPIELDRRRGRTATRRRPSSSDPAISKFVHRPPFEDRVVVYGAQGEVTSVVSDRACEELEFSSPLVELAREEDRGASARRHLGGRPVVTTEYHRRPDPSDLPAVVRQDSVGASFLPGHNRSMSSEAVMQKRPPPMSAPTTRLGATAIRTTSSPELGLMANPVPDTTTTPRRPAFRTGGKSTVDWQMSSSSESEGEVEDEAESESELPPMLAQRQRHASWAGPSTAAAASATVLPTVPYQPNSAARRPSDVDLGRPLQPRRGMSTDVTGETDYRREVQLARERREMSRRGEIERLATAKTLIERETARRQHKLSPATETAPSSLPSPRGHSESAPTSPSTRDTTTLPPHAVAEPGEQSRRRTTSNISGSSSWTSGSALPLTRRSLSQHDLASTLYQSTSAPPFFGHSPAMLGLPTLVQPVYVPVRYPAGHPVFPPGYAQTGMLGQGASQSTLALHQAGFARGRRQSGLQMSSMRPVHPAQRTSGRPRSPVR
jgi:hypothetical protein